MSSLLWDARTVLYSATQPSPLDGESTRTSPSKLGAIEVWNYLIRLSEIESSPSSDEKRIAKLKHFKATDFKQGWEDAPSQLGSGASYSVEKRTLAKPSRDGSPLVVAVKRLNFFRSGRVGFRVSSAQQYSVATVLKELRILTHPPLQSHINIVSLLGYRSEIADSEGHDVNYSSRGVDISLVMEFAPYGTLQDFLARGAGTADDTTKAPDLLTKARFMHDIAGGLEALHACGIAHGDVKLENTLVFRGQYRLFTVKLSDFGHALIDLDKGDIGGRRYLGTRLLNAPEVRSGSGFAAPADGDAFYKCDLYSYGLLIWELILDGKRFCTVLGDNTSSEDGDDWVSQLNPLPKDELLFKALISLKNQEQSTDERPLLQMLRSLLEATLRDDPTERKLTKDVVKIFREQKAFRDDDALNAIFTKDKPRPYPLPPVTIKESASNEPAEPWPQLPRAVQADLVMQLQSILKTAESAVDRRSALYDLAMCTFAGFGGEDSHLNSALASLFEAAQLGSPKALAIVFRLYSSLQREMPLTPIGISHPVVEIERNLARLESQAYFAERVRLFEQLYQQEAIKNLYDILFKGEIIASGVNLNDVQNHLAGKEGLDLEHLECVSNPGDTDSPFVRGLLIGTAARLGLLSLLEFLFTMPAPTSGKAHIDIVSSARDEDLLTAACRGAHLDVLEFLLSKGAEPTYQHLGTALHWLIMFPISEAERALNLLLATRGGQLSLQAKIPSPGIHMQIHRLCGTPLEFAIAVNNGLLAELFLKAQFSAKPKNSLTSVGWTVTTFRLAVSLNLSHLLPRLIPLELSYRRSRPTFAATSRFDRSQGKSEMAPFGLFDIACPPDPVLLLLIHGASSRAELEASIDLIIEAGICSINDEDASGSTALTHAVRFAPCNINADIISALISRGARFGREDTPGRIITNFIAKRRGRDAEVIMKLLLEAGILPLSIELLAAAAQTGNADIVKAILSFESHGKRLDAKTPFVEGGESVSVLFFAIPVPQNAQTIRLLLENGADLDATLDDRTPLEAAVSLPECDGDTIDLMITHGASLSLGGFSIVHRAASLRSQINGMHVLFHLLQHERVRAFVNTPCVPAPGLPELLPLYIACYAGIPGAVHALLQANAEVKRVDGLAPALDVAISVGRRPQTSMRWDGDLNDDEVVYNWRRDVEEIVLALLHKADPGHGRTQLHIAVELGNYRRVVELVERDHLRVFVGERNKLLPRAFLEDYNALENGNDSEAYIENLKQISYYMWTKLVEELCSDVENPRTIEGFLADYPASPSDSEENQQARSELQTKLETLKIASEESEASFGNGFDSPAELQVKISNLLTVQRQTFGDKDLKTLRTMAKLCGVYCMLNRFEEAEELQLQVLEGREAQLAEDQPELYEAHADRVAILCLRGKTKEAYDYARRVLIRALDIFGMKHPVTLDVTCRFNDTSGLLGDLDAVIESQELTLEVYKQLLFDSYGMGDVDLSVATLRLKSNLAFNYCRVQNFTAASQLVKALEFSLDRAKGKDFFDVFDILINGVARGLDAHKRYDDSEPIYSGVVEICLRKHRKRKSYCTQTALERLVMHYRTRKITEKECKALQQLVDVLKSTMGSDHPDTLRNMLELANAFGKQDRWAEASLLQERALQSLTQTLAVDHLDILNAKLALCKSLRKQGQLEKSEKVGLDALRGYRTRLGDDHDATLMAEDELGLTLSFRGKATEAIDLLQRRVDATVRVHGEMHHKTRQAVENLCAALLRQRRLDEAEAQAQRSFQISLDMPGTSDHVVAHSLYVLANCKKMAGDNDEAIELYVRSIQKEKAFNYAKNNEDTLYTMQILGKLYLEAEQYDKAEPILREILADASKVYKTDKQEVVQRATNYLGYACEATGRTEEAITLYKSAVALARRIYGDSAGETIACIDDLVRMYIEAGRLRDAHMPALEVLRYQREKLGECDEETVGTKADVCNIYAGLGMWPEAERMQRDVLRCVQAKTPGQPDSEDAVAFMAAISESCRKQGRRKEAETFGRRVLEYQLRERGGEDEETVKAMIDLAYVLVDAGQLSEAEQLGTESHEICGRVLDADHEQTAAAQSLCAYIYNRQDRFAEAEEVQQRVVERDPENIDELRFLATLYLKMKQYPAAVETCQKALAAAQSAYGDEALDYTDAVRTLIDLTGVYAAMGRWEDAKETGERARKSVERWRVPGLYEHTDVYLSALRTLKLVYEGTAEEEKLLEVELAIKRVDDDRKERRRQHLSRLEQEELRFQKS